jgi:zona occludens toxin
MITLITGTPGAGKTALALSMLLEEGKNRPLFVSGVKDLKVEHQTLPEPSLWTHYIPAPETPEGRKCVFDLPSGAIVLVDEAQNVYRPRGTGKAVPDYVAALETHRHGGLEIWLVTQHPALLDANVRKLITRHVHIKRTILGTRKLFEWTDEVGDVENRQSRQLAAARRYKPPKKVFSLYTSATEHIKTKRRIPIYAYVFVACICGVLGLSYYGYRSYQSKFGDRPQATLKGNGGPGPGADASTRTGPGPTTPGPLSWAEQQTPRVASLPHTAPVFDGITAPKSAPFPSACLSNGPRCTCYTDQATVLPMVDDKLCRQIVAGGFYEAHRESQRSQVFNPMEAPRIAAAPSVRGTDAAPAVTVLNDTFSGSHVGTVESTRVIGRGSKSPSLPNNTTVGKPASGGGDRPQQVSLNQPS